MHERYHKQRWIVRLDQHVKVVSHFLECANTACTRPAVVYRPQQEDALALRGYTFGLDVVARIGELRYRDNLSISKIREQLQAESPLSISLKLDFGHFPRNQIAGKWQADEGLIARVWEAD